jgi:benzoyl-CoA reductase subunit C
MKVDELRSVSSNPFGWVEREKAKGTKIIGYHLPDMPEEIVHAANAVPFLLTGGSLDISMADTRIQSYACSICRRSLAWALKGELEFLDGMVLPIVCDTSRTLAHILKKNCHFSFYESLLVPRIRIGSYTEDYLINELARFRERLEGFLKIEISNERLSQSISIYNENRRLLRELDARRKKNHSSLSNADFYNVVRSSFIIPKDKHNSVIKKILAKPNAEEENKTSKRSPRIFISGKLAEPMEFFVYLDKHGCSVVADDFWDSSLSFSSSVSESREPLQSLAHFFLNRIPSSVFFDPEGKRIQHLMHEVQVNSVDGVIFLHPKYCEPAAYDYPRTKKLLQSKGILSTLIEYDFGPGLVAELEKHLEIFVEILKSKT